MVCFSLRRAFGSALVLSTVHTLVTALPDLRIMPLGDSITKGNGSGDENGYRERLRNKLLRQAAISVDMIGSLSSGTMTDHSHEGHSGKYLADIETYWELSVRARPNVVLIHAGTNNMDKAVELASCPDIMESILDGLFAKAPDAVLVVAPIIFAKSVEMQKNTDAFNKKLKVIVETKQKAGKHILLAPIDITTADLADDKHPNDKGYEKMANAWLEGIVDADSRGWLKAPIKVRPSDLPGMGLGTGHTWEEVGTIRTAVANGRKDKVILADLNGDGIADYIVADDDGTIRAWLNGGGPNQWTSIGAINPSWKAVTGDMVRFADISNDGKADLIVLYADGAAKAWKNTQDGRKFVSVDSNWATGPQDRKKVHLRDMDGDGYADYVVIYSSGAVTWARNTHNNGKNDNARNFEPAQTIASGSAGVPNDIARVIDLDGDKRAGKLRRSRDEFESY